MKQIVNKLRSRAGETIGEVLVALLVSTLALMILAGMISAPSHIVKNSEKRMDAYYTANAGLEDFGSALGPVNVTIEVGSHKVGTSVVYQQNPVLGENRTVTAYKYNGPVSGG